ncbi:MAG: 23S rRNA (pseudouridine(1915)-N(3))-methyltransferase RlmH [candidate division WOR-3 bacterium]
MIRIICIGKTEPLELKKLQDYYVSLIKKHTKIEVIELKESREEFKDVSIRKECEKIKNALKYKPILLDVNGNLLTSEEFSKLILKYLGFGIDFIIGGVWGVCEELKKLESISLSKMTFNHNLIRIMLLEQIYRVFNPNFNK